MFAPFRKEEFYDKANFSKKTNLKLLDAAPPGKHFFHSSSKHFGCCVRECIDCLGNCMACHACGYLAKPQESLMENFLVAVCINSFSGRCHLLCVYAFCGRLEQCFLLEKAACWQKEKIDFKVFLP